MTDRIPWSRYEGDDIEAFAALCLYRERPRAVRIRPSRGDGGIDIYVKLDDGRVDIYQVKKYSEHLTPQQLYKIKDSYEKVKSYAEERHWRIATWYLVVPLEPTKENDEWLAELNKDDEFDAQWKGLGTFDNWAIDHPKVIDYYFHGGRERLQKALEQFTVVSSIMLPGVDPKVAVETYTALEPATVLDRLAVVIETLNEADPHFQYTVAIGPKESPAPESTGQYPMVVGSYHRGIGDQVASVHVWARFAESVEERPITMTGTVVVESGSDEERELRQFLDHGRLPRIPIPVRQMVADFPGGLGDTLAEARLLFKPLANRTEPFERVLTILNPEGDTLAEITAEFTEVHGSPDQTGATVSGTDRSGILTIELLSKVNGDSLDMTYNFSLADDVGKHPSDVLPALTFTNNLFAPNSLRVKDPRVPRRSHEQPIPALHAISSQRPGSDRYIRYVEALATIQQHAYVEIAIPEARTLSAEAVEEAMRTSRLLRGETVTVGWDQLTVTLNPGAPEIDDGGYSSLVVDQPLFFENMGRTVDLGLARYVVEAAEVARRDTDSEGSATVTYRPALGKKNLQIMWAGPSSIQAP
ncbi:hypothetical protein BS297_11535 [Rhodococcus erythropolis]|uniref:Restriction endonuclease type IV Mrr domain-containing protein n=1 Tax=Rhodococcus erythropolis TaxID=1833 RepID=A0A5N5E481_RHOER|nr:hypothetical protein BS297_11535 [Rhodococcus erythropolis]